MAFQKLDSSSGDESKAARGLQIGQVDVVLRSALHQCWMLLPPERRNLAELEREIYRLVDRAIKGYAEDFKAFGEK